MGIKSLPIGKLGNASYLRERFMTNIDDAVRDAAFCDNSSKG